MSHFMVQWSVGYFFFFCQIDGNTVCLLYSGIITVWKEDNISQHY